MSVVRNISLSENVGYVPKEWSLTTFFEFFQIQKGMKEPCKKFLIFCKFWERRKKLKWPGTFIFYKLAFMTIWYNKTIVSLYRIVFQRRKQTEPEFRCSKAVLKRQSNVWNLFKANDKDNRTISVFLISLMVTLNVFHTLLWSFYHWLWVSKFQLGVDSIFCKHLLCLNSIKRNKDNQHE